MGQIHLSKRTCVLHAKIDDFRRRARGIIFGRDNKMRLRYYFGDMIFTGRPHKVPPAKSYFFQADHIRGIFVGDLLSSPSEKIDYRMWAARFTLVYIFVRSHLTPRVMSVWKNKNPTSKKWFFLVV